MDQALSDAIALIRSTNTDTPEDPASYLAACVLVANNRGELMLPLHIRVPGPCGTENTDAAWDGVRAASETGCVCGNERVIFPLEMRKEFKAAETPPLILGDGQEVCIKLRGEPDLTALYMLSVEDEYFVIENDPFRPRDLGGMVAEMLGLPSASNRYGAKISDLVQAITDAGGKLVFERGAGERKLFAFAITAVDPDVNTVTITLDEVAESFTPRDPEGETGVSLLH